MSNFSFSNTLDGLNNINANDLDTDNIVTDYLTVNINSSVPLVTPHTANTNQIASCAFVQDAFTNNLLDYAKLNPTSPQTFTGSNNFPTQATSDNSTLAATTAFVKNQGYGKLTLASGSTLQSWFGANQFSSNGLNLPISLKNIDAPTHGGGMFVASGNVQYNPNVLQNDMVLLATGTGSGTGSLCLTTWSPNSVGIRIGSNIVVYNGATHTFNGTNNNFNGSVSLGQVGSAITLGGICSFTNTTTPIITQPILLTDNSTKIATTAFIKNNLLDYVTLNTTQTITANKTFNENVTLNKLFVSNYVDLTLTTYENQFYGDIYGYRGVVCQNGFYVKNTPGPGGSTYALIDSTGNISTTSTISATGNISTTSNISAQSITLPNNSISDSYLSSNVVLKNGSNVMTGTTNFTTGTNTCQTRPTFTNDTTLANTAFVNNMLASYLKLNNGGTNQILSGTGQTINNTFTTFNDTVLLNSSTQTTDTITFYDGVNATQFDQNGTNLTIYGTSTGGVKIGSGFNDNIVCVGTNRAYLQGTVGNQIDITGTQATIGGTSVPKITTQPLASSNTNEIATTQWSKTQLTGYATLNGNNTFNGLNNFTKSVEFKDIAPTVPVVIKNTVSSNNGGLVISGPGSYNGINSPGDFSVIGFGPTPDTGALTLTTWASGYCGIKIDNTTIKFNAPLSCNYYTLPTVPPLNVYDIGYMWEVAGATFNNWTGFTTTGNIATVNFDGIGGRKLGVWQVDIVLCTENTGSPNSKLIWTTVSATSNDLTKYCINETTSALYGLITVQVMRLSFILKVTTIPSTYYLNYYRTAGVGSGLIENKTNSHIQFTRIA